ncbi:ATP synthase I chain, partial [Dysosmobacter welbionis]
VFCHLPAGVFQRQLNLFECGSNGCDRPHCAGIYHSAPPATGSISHRLPLCRQPSDRRISSNHTGLRRTRSSGVRRLQSDRYRQYQCIRLCLFHHLRGGGYPFFPEQQQQRYRSGRRSHSGDSGSAAQQRGLSCARPG